MSSGHTLFSKSLSNLKPLLGEGYIDRIAEKLPEYSRDTVRNAFRGRLKDEVTLIKILTVARHIARENYKHYQRANSQAIKAIRKGKAIFFAKF